MSGAHLYPLSHGQQALWFLDRLSPGGTAYNFVVAVRVFGRTSVQQLRQAVAAVIGRHATLRTVFELSDGVPMQRVVPGGPVDLTAIELPDATDHEILERLSEQAYMPFALDRGVFRATILARGDDHYLLLTAHHIAIDFHSIGVLLEELGEYHRAQSLGHAAQLPPLTAEYADYVRLQRATLSGASGERLWQHWRRHLEGAPPHLELPVDHPRPPVQTFRGAAVSLASGRDVTQRLKEVAHQSGVTLYTVVLSAFQVLLHEWTRQDDVLVGCPTPGRSPEFARVVGYFVNPVVVRTKFTPGLSFADLLAHVHGEVTTGWDNQAYPFPLLVERLHPARDARYSPVFQVLFALYDLEQDRALPLLLGAEGARVGAGDLRLEPLMLEHRGAMLDLSLIVTNIDGSLTLVLQFNQDLFDRSTIESLSQRLHALLGEIARDPARVAVPDRRHATLERPGRAKPRRDHHVDFSLFFFAAQDERSSDSAYRLLFEAARFADRHGFAAVWTPERHFHPFGGIYPNPAVTGAAIAAMTTHLQVRAGSVVLPLHHPVRVAEEWAVVDNMSNGRVAVSFASGWHANDFVFAPDHFDRRREVMAREIETVRRLWRGEPATYVGGDGREVEVRVWPRPVQRELPIWITAFGSPDTFRLAGELDAGVLTHLLGQSIADLEAKIEIYRDARRRRGLDPAGGQVAVMLHTFIGDTVEEVREIVRDPFIAYLNTSIELARTGEQAGLPAQGEHYQQSNVDAFLQATFERYFATNTLFGTPESCAPLVERLRTIGATEIACLIDFGIDTDQVLASLTSLDRLRSKFAQRDIEPPPVDQASAQRVVARVNERVQSRRQAIARQTRARLAAGSRDGSA